MSLYEQFKGRNVIAAVKHLLLKGSLELRPSDGKIMPKEIKTAWNTPWVHHRPSYRHNCFFWNDIVFKNVIPNMLPRPLHFVPSHCMECYKVVVRPKTVEQLFTLADIQRVLDMPSKCGLEVRETVFGNYGGYFYCRGLEQGREKYKKVREMIDNTLGTDVSVILKRGCTEYEHALGPSNKWVKTELQERLEDLIESMFVTDIPFLSQQKHMKEHVKMTWIEEAYKLGDETVFKFTDNKPLYPAYVTYHEDKEEPEEPQQAKEVE